MVSRSCYFCRARIWTLKLKYLTMLIYSAETSPKLIQCDGHLTRFPKNYVGVVPNCHSANFGQRMPDAGVSVAKMRELAYASTYQVLYGRLHQCQQIFRQSPCFSIWANAQLRPNILTFASHWRIDFVALYSVLLESTASQRHLLFRFMSLINCVTVFHCHSDFAKRQRCSISSNPPERNLGCLWVWKSMEIPSIPRERCMKFEVSNLYIDTNETWCSLFSTLFIIHSYPIFTDMKAALVVGGIFLIFQIGLYKASNKLKEWMPEKRFSADKPISC